MKSPEINSLFEKNYKKIFRLALKMLKNYEDAEDATQNIMQLAYENLDSFRWEAKFSTWLYRIALNHIYSYSNKRKKRQKNVSKLNYSFPDSGNPEKRIYTEELFKKLDEIIEDLPPKQKEIFLLRYYSNLTFKKIAKILQKKVGTVKSSYFFAMKKIKESFKKKDLLDFEEQL
ncbi:MAG: sigma-70 family RNA polymerase sigma factor [Candidatus Cloacimonetes bacterium]|nr:sigma-70 family RNA polymerase sigma factor [Candidatus Cloacimonadota bacterium]